MSNKPEKVIFEVQVDSYPNKIGKIQIKETDFITYDVVLCLEDQEKTILTADRDQWGVYMTASDVVIAVEDGTRSFIDGLILCLQKIKLHTEWKTTRPTITIEEKEE